MPFVDAATGAPVDAMPLAKATVTSALLRWEGVVVERGGNPEFHPQDVTVPLHYLALNCHEPLIFEAKDARGKYRPARIDPGCLWINPAGMPFSHHVTRYNEYLLVGIDPQRAAAAVSELSASGLWEFRNVYNVKDTRLKLLMETLLAEVECGGENGPLFVETLLTAICAHFYRNYATRRIGEQAPRKLPGERLTKVTDFMKARLGDDTGLDSLARLSGLSRYEFIRQFKAATGLPPHRYLLRLRLEEARRRIGQGSGIAEVAYDLGFADQSHLTRHFRALFKTTPGTHARSSCSTQLNRRLSF